jgi:hypothetical protein
MLDNIDNICNYKDKPPRRGDGPGKACLVAACGEPCTSTSRSSPSLCLSNTKWERVVEELLELSSDARWVSPLNFVVCALVKHEN